MLTSSLTISLNTEVKCRLNISAISFSVSAGVVPSFEASVSEESPNFICTGMLAEERPEVLGVILKNVIKGIEEICTTFTNHLFHILVELFEFLFQ